MSLYSHVVVASWILFLLLLSTFVAYPQTLSGQESFNEIANRLSKPLISDDGKVYVCSEKNFFAFESNGSVSWTCSLSYKCSPSIAPVLGESRKIYVVAEDRVLKINPLNVGSSGIAVELFFGTESERPGEIIGLAVSISSSCVYINVKNRGLFAYRLQGKLHWSVGPVLYQHGYRQGCRKNITECYFSSVPVFDHCEASIYISNNEGEIYALSTHSPHFKWIQDFSSFGSTLTMTTGNNGVLYVTVAAKALVLAVDVSRGIILWLKSFGPLSTGDYAPAVDSNGWISIGSLDGYLYSFSPKGVLKKFPKVLNMDSVIQVSPVLDCSGYAIYVSQTQIEGKSTRIIGDYTYISGMKPEGVIFTLINPVTGTIFWSEKYPGQFSSEFLRNDLQHFLLDESVLLGFFAASNIGNPLPCRSSRHKFALSCSQITFKNFNAASLCMLPHEFLIYYMKYLHSTLCYVLESFILLLSTNCLVFDLGFSGAQLQSKDISAILHVGAPLGSRTSLRQFANVRVQMTPTCNKVKLRLLRLQKKSFDKSITELQRKVAEEAIANEVLEKLGNLVKEREGIHRKLSTSYSLGRDEVGSHSASLLPLSDRKTRSFSFQGAKKESVTLFHTVSGTSSETSWSGRDSDTSISEDEEETYKGKSPIEISSCSDDEIYHEEYQSSNPSFFASSSKYAEEIEEMKPGDQKDPLIFPYRTAIQA
ncbi:protein GAMETE EXPRESSED 3 [Capsicum annuum]